MQPKRVEYVSCLVCGLIGVLIGCLGLIPLVVLYTQRESQTNISYSLESAYHCGGISPYYLWTPYEPTGITMNIDTTRCKFNSTPLYFTSLGGTSSHFLAAGYTGIYSPQKNSFAIYARLYTTSNAVNMLNMSTLYKWNVHWLGVMY